jgi:hypothetical protein
MDHDGSDVDSIKILTPGFLLFPFINLLGASTSLVQIPMSSRFSNERPAVVVEDLNLMEGLILKKATETAERVLDLGFVEVVLPFVQKQPRGTQGKKSTSEPRNEGRGSKNKADRSEQWKSKKSPRLANEETEVL